MIKLFNDDCLKILPTIPDNSIDLVLTDPPYGTTQCKWDSVIPFEPMWKELKRVIKDNTAIAIFGTEPFSSYLRLSNLSWFKYDWIWNKNSSTGFMNAKLRPMNTIELISIFSNGRTSPNKISNMVYNPQGLIEHNKIAKSGNKPNKENSKFRENSSPANKDGYIQKYTNYPKNYLEFGYQKKAIHPTQKPVALLEYLIKTYTNENDTILDFTMGSGSTGVACKNTNRNFIGIEKDEKYFEIAKKRIEDEICLFQVKKQ
jgi:site-specific DNA-methyltransferase (adenine-specific)